MSAVKVHCDECGWEDSVATLAHLRAWYRACCPVCGLGELVDAAECLVAEELIAMETVGLVRVHERGPVADGELVMHVDTAADPICTPQLDSLEE